MAHFGTPCWYLKRASDYGRKTRRRYLNSMTWSLSYRKKDDETIGDNMHADARCDSSKGIYETESRVSLSAL